MTTDLTSGRKVQRLSWPKITRQSMAEKNLSGSRCHNFYCVWLTPTLTLALWHHSEAVEVGPEGSPAVDKVRKAFDRQLSQTDVDHVVKNSSHTDHVREFCSRTLQRICTASFFLSKLCAEFFPQHNFGDSSVRAHSHVLRR